jgi:hypothetical protein
MKYDAIELLKNDYTSLSTPLTISHPTNTLTKDALDPGTYVLKFSNTSLSPSLGVYHEISTTSTFTYTFSIPDKSLVGRYLTIKEMNLLDVNGIEITTTNLTLYQSPDLFYNKEAINDSNTSTYVEWKVRVLNEDNVTENEALVSFTTSTKVNSIVFTFWQTSDGYVPFEIKYNGVVIGTSSSTYTEVQTITLADHGGSQPTYVLTFDGYDILKVSGFVAAPNIVKVMRAPLDSTEFEYIGNMTYDAASKEATFNMTLNGTYKAVVDSGDAPEVETTATNEIVYTPMKAVNITTVVCGDTPPANAHIYRLTAKDSENNDVIFDASNFTAPVIYRPNDSDARLYTSNYTTWAAGTNYGTVYNDYSINISGVLSEVVLFKITGVMLSSISIHQMIHKSVTSWDLENAKIKYNDTVFNDGVYTRIDPDPDANSTSDANIVGVVDKYMITIPTQNKSTVTGATLAFDGYDQLTLSATGTNIDSGFGYLVEHSVDGSSSWTQVTGGSGMVTDGGTSAKVTITQAGHYRAKAQGTDGGAAVATVLAV